MTNNLGKLKNNKLIVFTIAAISIVCVSAFLFVVYDVKKLRSERISERIVDIPIGAYTFAFPRNVIRQAQIGKDNPRRSLISLEFLLPDFLPKTVDTIDQFSVYNTLTVNISAMDYKKTFQREGEETYTVNKIDTSFEYDITPILERKLSETFPDGTLRYPVLGKGKLVNGLMYYEQKGERSGHIFTNANGPVYLMLECSDTSWPNPNCRFNTYDGFLGHMSLHYRYPLKYIDHAEEIHEFVFSYLQSHFNGVTDND